MRPQRPHLPFGDTKRPPRRYQRVEFSQDKSVGYADDPGKRATIACDTAFCRNDQRRLKRRQPGILRLHPGDKRQKLFGIILVCVQAASLLRNDTIIDFDVGVSLSSPALPSGTSTLSSG